MERQRERGGGRAPAGLGESHGQLRWGAEGWGAPQRREGRGRGRPPTRAGSRRLPQRSSGLRMAPSLPHTRTRSHSHYPPPRAAPRENARVGEPLTGGRRGGKEEVDRGHRPTEPSGWAGGVTCVRESWAAAAMVFPSCTRGEGRTGRLGLGAGRRRRERPEARPGQAGGRASPRTSTTSLLCPPRPAPPGPAHLAHAAAASKSWRRRLRRRTGACPQGPLGKTRRGERALEPTPDYPMNFRQVLCF